VLLNPGVVLRMGENSSVRLLSSKLTDTRVEILKGSAILESNALSKEAKDNAITLVYKGITFEPQKNGLYRLDTDPARVRVYDGELLVRSPGTELRLKRGHEAMLDGALVAGKFDPKADDDLYRWSARRSGYMAEANVYSARSLSNSYYGGYGNYGSSGQGGWMWNPYFGMFSWIPYSGVYYNAFGYAFWSPYSVYQTYYPYNYGGGGGGGSSSSSRGYQRPATPSTPSNGTQNGSFQSSNGSIRGSGNSSGGFTGGAANSGGMNSGGGGGAAHSGGGGGHHGH